MEKDSKFIEECTGACDWDSLILKRFLEFVPENSVVADIGANHGIFTLNILKNIKIKEIYAIEPDHQNFDILKLKTKGESNVNLINAAVSNYNGEVDIWDGNGDHATRNILGEESFWGEGRIKRKTCTVDCATLDYIFGEKLKIKLDVSKIDVEGAELLVFEGGKKVIPQMKCIFAECHTNETYQGLVKMCLENNWEIVCLKNLHRITSIEELDFCYQVIIFPQGR